MKPPGRVADVRLPLAHIHPLSRGPRPADGREVHWSASNQSRHLAGWRVYTVGDRLGTTRGLGVDERCITVCTT